MKKLKRANLTELAKSKAIISFLEQRRYVGGGSGTQEDPFTYNEFMATFKSQNWNGGWVQGVTNNDGILSYCGGTGAPIYVSPNTMYTGGTGPQADTVYDGGTGGKLTVDRNDYSDDDELHKKLKDICIAAGGDISILSQYNFQEGSRRAGLSKDRKTILVSLDFLDSKDLSAADKYSILSHEIYHTEHDVVYDTEKLTEIHRGDYSFSSDMSDGALAYFKKIYSLDSKDEIIKYLNDIYESNEYYDVQRYHNEIKAYEYELLNNHNISEDYRNEIEGKIYQYKEYINIINNKNK